MEDVEKILKTIKFNQRLAFEAEIIPLVRRFAKGMKKGELKLVIIKPINYFHYFAVGIPRNEEEAEVLCVNENSFVIYRNDGECNQEFWVPTEKNSEVLAYFDEADVSLDYPGVTNYSDVFQDYPDNKTLRDLLTSLRIYFENNNG